MSFSVQEEMALSSVQIRVGVASCCIHFSGGFRLSSMAVEGIFPRNITSVLFNTAAYQFIQMFKAAAFILDSSLYAFWFILVLIDTGLGSNVRVIDFRFSAVTNVESILGGSLIVSVSNIWSYSFPGAVMFT